jgi:hypothetical protein
VKAACLGSVQRMATHAALTPPSRDTTTHDTEEQQPPARERVRCVVSVAVRAQSRARLTGVRWKWVGGVVSEGSRRRSRRVRCECGSESTVQGAAHRGEMEMGWWCCERGKSPEEPPGAL